MFGLFNDDDLDARITQLESDIKALVDENEALKAASDNAVASAPVVIDFNVMRVFSIERNSHDGRPVTIIGHFMYDPIVENGQMVAEREKTKEWYLYCNEERHSEIVNQFKEWKADQNG